MQFWALQFKRKMIAPNDVEFVDHGGRIVCKTLIPREQVEKIESAGLRIAPIMLIKKSICLPTGENYITAKGSKYLDDNIHEEFKDFELLGNFWTNRHAWGSDGGT